MALTQSRPEKQAELIALIGAIRNDIAKAARDDGLNISEAFLALGGAFAAVLAGAYKAEKDRETVIEAIPHVIRSHIPQWDKIYADHAKRQPQR